jgi:antitoxin component YwqK of YwqJK toxin-antitoxin module
LFYTNGAPLAVEQYKAGALHGKYVAYDIGGKPTVVGTYTEGKESGVWEYSKNGVLRARIPYQNGMTNGAAVFYTGKGVREKTSVYVDNVQSGEEVKYYSDGTIMASGSYEDGEMSGEWKAYDTKGRLMARINYADGRKHGAYTQFYAASGSVKVKGQHEKGKRSGTWNYYTKGGALDRQIIWRGMSAKRLIEYEGGKKTFEVELFDVIGDEEITVENYQGEYIEYYPDGESVKTRGKYAMGDKSGEWKEYDKNGEVTSKERYVAGQKRSDMLNFD